MKLYVEMTEEEYEEYKGNKKGTYVNIDKINIHDFLKLKGYVLEKRDIDSYLHYYAYTNNKDTKINIMVRG